MKNSKTQLMNLLILNTSSIFFLIIIFVLAINQEYNAYGKVDFLGFEKAATIILNESSYLWIFLLSVGAGIMSLGYSFFIQHRALNIGEFFVFMFIIDMAALAGFMCTVLVQDIFLLSVPSLILCTAASINYVLHLLKNYQIVSI